MRRLITRLIAIIPAIAVILLYGSQETGQLLILSQVVLSFQLPFAIVPLVMFTASRAKMGETGRAALADGTLCAGRHHHHLSQRQFAVVRRDRRLLIGKRRRQKHAANGVFTAPCLVAPVAAGSRRRHGKRETHAAPEPSQKYSG